MRPDRALTPDSGPFTPPGARPAAGPPLAPAAASGIDGHVLPFRRTAVKPRRRRRRLLPRLVRPLATAVLLVALPVGVGGWVLSSPRFALAELEVRVGPRVDAAWVESRLAPLVGRNLVAMPLPRVEAALAGHPWIEAVSIRKQLPDGLAVEVVERRPAVLVPEPAERPGRRMDDRGAEPDGAGTAAPRGERLWLADAAGRPIVPAPPEAAAEYVLVVPAAERGAAVGPLAAAVPGALSVAADLARSRPVWAAGLERIEALGQDEYRLRTAALPFPLLVRAGEVEPRAGRLAAALPALREHMGDIGLADLRFAGRLVVRPAEATAVAAGGATTTTATGGVAPSRDDMRRKVG
jgi:hypothetical protein